MLKAVEFFLYTPPLNMTYVSTLLGTLFPKEFAKFVFFSGFLIWGADSYILSCYQLHGMAGGNEQ